MEEEYKIHSTQSELLEFFESSTIWLDIENSLKTALAQVQDEFETPISRRGEDPNPDDWLRGRIFELKDLLDTPALLQEEKRSQIEEKKEEDDAEE